MKAPSSKSSEKFLQAALAIQEEDAQSADAIGFMGRALVQATLPHKNPGKTPVWGRENGHLRILMQSGYDIKDKEPVLVGLPYGSIPRLLLAFLTTEAVRTKDPTIVLGRTLSSFMEELDLVPTGGRWGSITRLKEQTRRLFSASVQFKYGENKVRDAGGNFHLVKEYDIWWTPKDPNQGPLWESTVTLSDGFFQEITNRPVPVDMRALKVLKRSPMQLDLYCWLTYRVHYLRKPTVIPWESLQLQFGADYTRIRDFRAAFLRHLKAVGKVYPEIVGSTDFVKAGFKLKPTKSHIR